MRSGESVSTDGWQDAVARATEVVVPHLPGEHEGNWDFVATRDIVAMVLYALHIRDERPVAHVPWDGVLWYLDGDERVISLVEGALPGLAPASADGPADERVAERWRWLNRTWDPHAPVRPHPLGAGGVSGARWEGLSRGIGRTLPDPAVEVCTSWAAAAVETALNAERGGYHLFQRVRVAEGVFRDQYGYVRRLDWVFDDDARRAVDGPPAWYLVDLDEADAPLRFDARCLAGDTDGRQWPERVPGSLKSSPPASPGGDEAPRVSSCAEHLAEVLGRATNPEAIPDRLRQAVAGAHSHHHQEEDHQARPRPHRVTWQVISHWYQVTENYSPDAALRLWEVVIKTHLHDDGPVHHLAADEAAVQPLVARYAPASS
ncbi:hypothetical protein AB0B15_11585 [Streptomyces sp. NPDC045456]|uniref:hypothetical protein n=1 Tax=Streptomyces sp. NPDC045456 TaxID=3155254 RepID=UPI0034061930